MELSAQLASQEWEAAVFAAASLLENDVAFAGLAGRAVGRCIEGGLHVGPDRPRHAAVEYRCVRLGVCSPPAMRLVRDRQGYRTS